MAPTEKDLIISTLKQEAYFGMLFKDYKGKENRVPWWIIKPMLKWQQHGDATSTIPADGAKFFLEAHEEDGRRPVGASLRLECGSLHSEWYLRPTEIQMRTHFGAGSVFLSVV